MCRHRSEEVELNNRLPIPTVKTGDWWLVAGDLAYALAGKFDKRLRC